MFYKCFVTHYLFAISCTLKDIFNSKGEEVERTIIHEEGHAFDNEVLRQALPPKVYEVEKYDMIGNTNVGVHNPIYQTFARVNGWKLVPLEEVGVFKGYSPKEIDYIKKTNQWPTSSPGAWVRDEAYWPKGKVRLTVYATHRPIQETFAEYFMASRMYPEYLTPDEQRYFLRIHKGLIDDVRSFIALAARNPEVLLD